jgi:hypothetical protein
MTGTGKHPLNSNVEVDEFLIGCPEKANATEISEKRS